MESSPITFPRLVNVTCDKICLLINVCFMSNYNNQYETNVYKREKNAKISSKNVLSIKICLNN